MKKVALLITGQPRIWQVCGIVIKNLLLNNPDYDVDIFLSIDHHSMLQNDRNEKQYNISINQDELTNIIDYFNPVDYYLSTEGDADWVETELKKFDKTQFTSPTPFTPTEDKQVEANLHLTNSRNGCLKSNELLNQLYFEESKASIKYIDVKGYTNLIRQHYIVGKAYQILNQYIEKTNIQYDLVIKTRFDYILIPEQYKINPSNFLDLCSQQTLESLIKVNQMSRNAVCQLDKSKGSCLNLIGGGRFDNFVYVNEQFWSHGCEIIEKMSNLYIEFPKILRETIYDHGITTCCCIEHCIAKFMYNNGIKFNKTIIPGQIVRKQRDLIYPVTNKYGFIVLRCVKNVEHNNFWNRCCRSINLVYPECKIVIIDDHSDESFLKQTVNIKNVQIYKSNFTPGSGEVLPYYYYHKYGSEWFEKAIIIHDSVIINNRFDMPNSDFLPLWHFPSDMESFEYGQVEILKKVIDNRDTLLQLHNEKEKWSSCFGAMCILSRNYLNQKISLQSLNNICHFICDRGYRCAFERAIACILYSNKLEQGLFDAITSHPNAFSLTYDFYQNNKNLFVGSMIIKFWSGR